MYYEPIFRKFIRRLCKQLLDDGVFYVDMRSAFYTPYRSAGKEDWDEDWFNMLEHMDDEIEKFKKSEEGKEFWGARMIWTTIRAFDKKQVIKSKPLLTLFQKNIRIMQSVVNTAYTDRHRHETMHRHEDRIS